MPIQKIARDGATTYKVQIRRRGFPSVFKTFDRYADARAFEERTQREQKVRAAHGCGTIVDSTRFGLNLRRLDSWGQPAVGEQDGEQAAEQ